MTINFSTADLMNVETKAIIDPSVDINTLHLILFDENGMLVEVCEATKLGSSDHGDHASGRHYTVTLTTTDKPRIIHYVANCPLDQITYGHESSIIGNMFVDKNNREHSTEYETSYWARIEVPYILVEEKEEDGKTVTALHGTIINKFQHVPLLRNYAEITVTDATDDTFIFEGYTVYNILDRGTVAPYNRNLKPEPGFQNFFYWNTEAQENESYSYPQLTAAPYLYEGHVLSSANLISELPKDNGTVKIFKSNEPFYIYERKVSVMTDEEDKWKESPPHIIIKGQFKPQGSNTWNTYYYKMDLLYKIKDSDTGIDTEIKYYHILRNFMYQFNLTKVHDEGYKTLEEAIAGAAGNNISGSANAAKLTNISDNKGRLWVSYTDTTLVNNNTISLKYKYIPNYYDTTGDDYGVVQNDKVRFENIVGDVISGISGHDVAANDINDPNGIWDGYRKVTISVKEPEAGDVHYQVLSMKTNSANLNREIRYTLRETFNMTVECTPKVAANMLEPVHVDVKLPIGLTEDMFPLTLKMETIGKKIAPDATTNSIPVETGPSIIDVEGIKGTNSFYYVFTIPTFDDYKNKTVVDNTKIYSTYWLTTLAANASTIYVDNKYFNQASDSWENYSKTFSDVSITPTKIPYGVGMEASVSFTMPNNDNTPVTLEMTGLEYAGSRTLTVTPTDGSAANVSVTTSGSNKIVTVTGLTTSTATDDVKVYIDAEAYKYETLTAIRVINQFGVSGSGLGFNPSIITSTTDDLRGLPVEFTFTVPTYYDGMVVNVTLDGLIPNDDDRLKEVEGRAAIKTYTFEPNAEETTYTLQLKTINKDACTCSLTLESEKYYYETETLNIEQKVQTSVTYSGTINVTETLTFNSSLQTNDNQYKVNNASVTIDVDGASHIESGNLTYSKSTETIGSWWNQTYYITGLREFTIQNVSITGDNIDENTNVTITITVTSDRQQSGSRTVTYTNTIGELGLTR